LPPHVARLGILLALLLLHSCLHAQLSVRIVPTYAGAPLLREAPYALPAGDSVRIQTFRCYIVGLQAWAGDKPLGAPSPPQLLDLDNPASLGLTLPIPASARPDALSFQLGIDSLTNVSGALGGDLDPTLGMYWAWQSGYINVKLEGSSPLCPTRHHAFQFHLGGYLAPHGAVQVIRLPLPDDAAGRKELVIGLAVDRFLADLDLRSMHTVMRPCAEAAGLSQRLATLFTLLE
jgi:hypothetical protein